MIADLAPIDHDPHRLAVTVYHHEVEGRREGVILEGLRQRVRVVSLVEPHRQHAAIWADGTKDAGLLHSDIDAVAQRLLKIFFHLWVSIGFRERVGERRALLTHHDIVMVSPAAPRASPVRYFGLGEHRQPGKKCRGGLPHGARRVGLEASRARLPTSPMRLLGQGQEPGASRADLRGA